MSARADLKTARQEQRLVEVVRRKGWARFDGYVIAVTRGWSAVQVVDHGLPAGVVLLRTADVRKVRKPSSDATLSRRTLEHAGHWPPQLSELVDLHDVRTVLATAGSLAPVLGLAAEQRRAGRSRAGTVFRITSRRVQWRQITAEGKWARTLTSWRLNRITRVEFGSPHLEALRAVAGTPLS